MRSMCDDWELSATTHSATSRFCKLVFELTRNNNQNCDHHKQFSTLHMWTRMLTESETKEKLLLIHVWLVCRSDCDHLRFASDVWNLKACTHSGTHCVQRNVCNISTCVTAPTAIQARHQNPSLGSYWHQGATGQRAICKMKSNPWQLVI